MMERIVIRNLRESDPIPEITGLLHQAYAPLAAMGLRYTATHQDGDVTRSRLASGWPWVAMLDGEIVATVTLYQNPAGSEDCAWYRQPGVFSFGQLAVRPDLQGHGLGGRLFAMLETEAAMRGAGELALDTADGADHLIRWYEKIGFRFIEHVSWSNTNYRSVVLSKTLEVTARI